jgi:glyoxylase-like metal-dependent hydrolase (beta-lactamase superfamily II)
MAEVKVLIEGWTNADTKAQGEDETTCCTSCLITDDNLKIVTDPGVLADQKIMTDALARENLTVNDITHVFITHSHIDHYRNIGMFPKAKTVEYWGLWDGAKTWDRPEKMSNNIDVIETPGHNYDGLSMLVNTKQGKIAVVGDVWWKENYPENDPYASDLEKLAESREKILKIADYIIPGHGDMFEVKK